MDNLSLDESSSIYLADISPRDKIWDNHKIESRDLAKLYDQAGFESYSKRIWECGRSLQFALKRDDQGTMKLKLKSTRFCRVRWCPICFWRRGLMWKGRFIKVFPAILEDYPKTRFVFLTLTVRNCRLEDLRSTLMAMNRAWKLLTMRKQFPGIGWLKTIEVTRDEDGFAHPHFHILLMVNPSYFTHGYISQARWSELWQDCLEVNYTPIVNIKVVKNRSKKRFEGSNVTDDLISAILETIKYCVKVSDLVSDPVWLKGLTDQMYKLRAISVGGIFKKYLSEDDKDEDLINTGIEDEDLKDEDQTLIFYWAEIVRRYAQKV
jgi:plasmid rolling circle replication initiator protein Rep